MAIPFETALDILLENCHQVGAEVVALEGSLNRVSSEDVYAKENIPGFKRSSMDGYALISLDTEKATEDKPVSLTVLEELKAGDVPHFEVTSGNTIKVMTSGIIPNGADSVIKFEDIKRKADTIFINKRVDIHSNIIDTGEDIAYNQIIAKKGEVISPPLMGVLASIGLARVNVYKKVKVAILSTGNELCAINEELIPGKIRNSNAYSLSGYCQSIYAEPLFLGIALDEKQDLKEKFTKGIDEADIIISTGGSSVGDYDLVGDVLIEMGAEVLFNGVGMKPGKPTLAAKIDDKLVISLSGNPSAAVTSFLLMLVPTIKKMGGYEHYHLFKAKAALLTDFPKVITQRRFLRGKLIIKDDKLAVDLSKSQKNSVLTSMIGCDVFLDVPKGSNGIKKGEILSIHVFDKVNLFK